MSAWEKVLEAIYDITPYGATYAEVESIAGRIAEARAEDAARLQKAELRIATLEEWLAECYRLSGADPDSNEDWRLADRAVVEVAQMRREFDILESRIVELERQPVSSDGNTDAPSVSGLAGQQGA